MQSIMRALVISMLIWGFTAALNLAPAKEMKNVGAVILLYHHVAENTPRSTSVTPDEFAEHLAFIKANYVVFPLKDIVEAAKHNTPLPDNALAITFDDGYNNIYENAHPLLKEYGFPYTVFINPSVIGVQSNQLSWDTVKTMHNEGVTFANHTLDHLHMLEKRDGESEKQWLNRVWQNVTDAETEITAQVGESLKYLAYPFGEYNEVLTNKLQEQGYIGFGQHSGAVGPFSNLAAIPRFPAAGPYAKLSTLKTKMASFAMPVVNMSLSNPELSSPSLSAPITVTLDATVANQLRINQVTCYYQGDTLPVEVNGGQFSVDLNKALPVGRSRVNCTAPSKTMAGRYFWYSIPFFRADKNGKYPD